MPDFAVLKDYYNNEDACFPALIEIFIILHHSSNNIEFSKIN